MKFIEAILKDVYIIEIDKIEDERGFFARSFCKNEMEIRGLNTNIVQTNIAFNPFKGTLRGMHFQKAPHEETKFVRCTKGSIYDVVIDLRPESKTFKKWMGIELNEENHKTLYVPKGFAHGYLTLSDNSEISYMVTEYYNSFYERGVRWNDHAFEIQWPGEITVISQKDSNHPDFIV